MQENNHPLQPLGDALSGRSLLFVTSGGAAAETRFAVDPEIAEFLEACGVRVNQTSYEQLDEQVAAAHDAVIFGAFPKTDAPELVQKVLSETFPSLLRAVHGGTGLLLMVDDHYSRIFVPLNEALAPLGIEVLCEDIHDSDPERNGCIASSPEIATLVADAVGGAGKVLVPNGWQSGVWPLLASDPSWRPLLTGSPTSEARVLRHEQAGRGGKSPVLAAVRHHGKGRIAVLAAHSTFFFGNGMHPRWGRGLFLTARDNVAFLAALLADLCSARPPRALVDRITLPGSGVMPWFNPVPGDEQPVRLEPQRGLVAVEISPDGKGPGADELAHAARDAGFAWAVFAARGEGLGDDGWQRLCDECARVSDDSFQALPAVDFKADNDYGTRGLAVLPDFWPPRGTNRRFVIQMIEEGGGWLVFSSPWASPVPPSNIGGFQGFEVAGYEGPSQELSGRADETFVRLQSHDWFLAPVCRFRAHTADEIRAAAARESTYVMASGAADVAARIPKVGHCEFGEVFVSGGPLLREFWMEGPGMTRDVWEGRYYTWSQDPGEVAVLHIKVSSMEPLKEVVLWESGRAVARFFPGGNNFAADYEIPNTRASYSYWVTATDHAGGSLVGMARRTKSGLFRAHGGGDRMNTYGSVIVPTGRGEFELRGKRCSTSATMLFGLGWRQHQLNIYPPVPAVDYQPEGGEWGAPHGRLERIYLNPFAVTAGGPVGQRVLEERAGFDFTSDEAALLDERITLDERMAAASAPASADVHLEKFSPAGSVVSEMREFRATGRYIFGRWYPQGGPVLARFEREITFLEDLCPEPQGGIALRLLRMQADTSRFLQNVFVGGSACPAGVLTVGDLGAGILAGERAVAGIFPQPYGAFGFVQIEGPALAIRTTTDHGVAALEAGLPLPSGGGWKAGETVRVVMLMVVSGLPDDSEALFRGLRELTDESVGNLLTMTHGLYAGGHYPVMIDAAAGAASWTMNRAALSTRLPMLTAVRGFRAGDAVWAVGRGGEPVLPVAVHDGTAYFTVPDDWTDVLVGTPVIVDPPCVATRLWPNNGGWNLSLHNNSDKPVAAEWRSNPHFQWRRDHRGAQVLEAGATTHTFLSDLT